jgi:hypothetical protein
MKTALFTIGAAVSAIAFATPASAQYYPAPPAYGYGYGYQQPPAYGYGYNQAPVYGYGHARALKARLDHTQREIRRLAQYRMISRNEYQNLIRDSREIEYRLIRNARDGRGLSPQEAFATERRMVRLEQKIARDVRDGRQWRYRW